MIKSVTPLVRRCQKEIPLQLCHKDSILSTPNTLFTLTHHRPFTVHYWLLAVPYGGVSSQAGIVVASIPGRLWPLTGIHGGGKRGAGGGQGRDATMDMLLYSPKQIRRIKYHCTQGGGGPAARAGVQTRDNVLHCQLWLSLPSQVLQDQPASLAFWSNQLVWVLRCVVLYCRSRSVQTRIVLLDPDTNK